MATDSKTLQAVLNYMTHVAAATDPDLPPFVDAVLGSHLDRHLWANEEWSEGMARLFAIDELHRHEHLLWEGRFWILGTVDGVDLLWPLLRRRATRTVRREVRSLGPWRLSDALVPATRIDEVNAWVPEFNEIHFGGPHRALRGFLDAYLQAVGLPPLPYVDAGPPPQQPEPGVYDLKGYFVDRHPYDLNRTNVLRLWAGRDLESTAFAKLYAASGRRRRPVKAPKPGAIRSPFELNEAQSHTLLSARREPLTVVSGPPGTGKSHLVAATAIDQVTLGRSVLIATQSIHASQVILDMLDRHPTIDAVRFGDQQSARQLGDRLASGVASPTSRYDLEPLAAAVQRHEAAVNRQRERLTEHLRRNEAFDDALTSRHTMPLWLASKDLSGIDLNALRRLSETLRRSGGHGWWKRRATSRELREHLGRDAVDRDDLEDIIGALEAERLVETSLAGRDDLDHLWADLERLEERWRAVIGDHLEAARRQRTGPTARATLQSLATALREPMRERRIALAELGSEMLDAVPLWVGTLDEIEAVLPGTAGLFDLVILDEASQISQISAVPALVRAHRALIVGDSRQLRHVSALTDAEHAHAAEWCELDSLLASRLHDRANSVFDAATAVAPVIELHEHFRSTPHIIEFANREFYDGRLRLMTQHPANEGFDAIDVIRVPAVEDEVATVLRLLHDEIASDAVSLGVVSPIDDHAAAIERAIVDWLPLERIEHHELQVGSVQSFQGTEKDHVIIALGIAADDEAARAVAQDPAVFNVMITRARHRITVVTALEEIARDNDLIGRYLRYETNPPLPRRESLDAHGWTQRVASDLASLTGLRVITNYEVAGESVDIAIGEGPLAVGLDTEVHPAGASRHIERRKALVRAGWRMRSFHHPDHFGREEEAIAKLAAALTRQSSRRVGATNPLDGVEARGALARLHAAGDR